MRDIKKLKEAFKKAVEELVQTKDKGITYFWELGTVGDERRGIVLAWQDGYEPDNTGSRYADGECRICAKLACQPVNSLMQEYDIDWLMPYDEKTGFVDDNEITVDGDTDAVIDWLLKCYEPYQNRKFCYAV